MAKSGLVEILFMLFWTGIFAILARNVGVSGHPSKL